MSRSTRQPARVFGFTVGFDGKAEYAPITVQRYFDIEPDSINIDCHGLLAELAFKYPDRVRIECKDCSYRVGMITRTTASNSTNIQIIRNHQV